MIQVPPQSDTGFGDIWGTGPSPQCMRSIAAISHGHHHSVWHFGAPAMYAEEALRYFAS
jgi:hypothetical protein